MAMVAPIVTPTAAVAGEAAPLLLATLTKINKLGSKIKPMSRKLFTALDLII